MFDKMTMRNRLLLILIVPLLGLLFFSITITIEKGLASLQMNRIGKLMDLSVKLGNAAHQIQIERALTSGFVTSKGQKFATELPLQRKEADDKVSILKQAILDFENTSQDTVLGGNVDEVTRLLNALDSKRAAASSLTISPAEVIEYYSQTIGAMVSVPRQVLLLTGDSRLTRLAAAYSSFAYAKEHTGIERAIFMNVFSAKKFDQERLARFYANDAVRKLHFREFEAAASATQLSLYREKTSGLAANEVMRMKNEAVEGADGRDLDINPEHWFAMVTALIDQLKEVDDKLASELLGEVGTLKTKAGIILGIYLLLTLLALIATGMLAQRTIQSILRQLGGEPSYAVEIAGGIASGDLSMKIVTEPEDSQSVIAAFKAMQSKMSDELAREVKVQEEVFQLVSAAASGNLTRRITLEDKQGFMKRLSEGINQTLDAVVSPIGEASRALERMAAKDLTARMEGEYKGDFVKIKNSLNLAVEHLDQSLQQVRLSAEQVTSASGQIGSGSQVLAQGSSEQASSLEEISSSLQEMTSMTKQNTANAREAKGLSDAARKGADKGVVNMNMLSAAVDRIKKSSDSTAKIVKTIDEIAFQTNLLALNAAVEAARAGDAGKGFAVVAEEVRNLAMRSAEAAKNTSNMIEESVKNAESGVSLNLEVLKNFEEINTQVSKVSEVMAEIATSSEQQFHGIEQVNTAVQQMSQLTQQGAANSEESASAAEELSAQAQEMQTMVAGFVVSGDAGKAKQLHPEKNPMKPRKMPALAMSHKDPASVIPFGDEKKALRSF